MIPGPRQRVPPGLPPMNHHEEGHFSAPDGTRLWFERDVPDGARAHIVLVHGFGDHLGRYR